MDEHPKLTNIRDPPILIGQLIRCVLVFHSGSYNPRIEMRGLTCTVPPFVLPNKEMSRVFAKSVFDLAKADLESADPDKIRAGEMTDPLRF